MLGHEACLEELLRFTNDSEEVRTDLLVSAFTQLGTISDKAILDVLITKVLAEPELGSSGPYSLIALCPDEARVKEYAISTLAERNPRLALLASVYRDDPSVRGKIAEQVGSLTASMRLHIIDAASREFDRNDTAKKILSRYDIEDDGQLKIQGAIKNYQALYPTDIDRRKVINDLLSDANAVGHDYEERRAAAFAGLITYNATEKFAALEWNNKPLEICLGTYGRESQALLRLVAEHWDELDQSFEKKFISRFKHSSSESHFWTLISPYVSNSSLLREKFIDYCGNTTKCLEAQQFQALAKELPKSDLLLRHCLLSIKSLEDSMNDSPWSRYQSYFEASYILRDQFSGDIELLIQLQKMLHESNFQHGVAAMAIYDPFNPSLDNVAKEILSEIDTFEPRVSSIILAASRFESKPLEVMVRRMINRTNHSLWDFQDRVNYAIKSRIGSNEEFAAVIRTGLTANPTESEISSFSRYLGSTGKLDEDTQKLCQHLLNERYVSSRIPANGYDAVSDLVRPVVHSLLDVLAGPIH
jgi:hypothetical protein